MARFLDYLGLRLVTFADVGLNSADPDDVVWQRCQELKLLLITDNRNDAGPDSLEATIRRQNSPDKLPVFTIGDIRAVPSSRAYADRVIDRLLRDLLELENIRGTGRLFVP